MPIPRMTEEEKFQEQSFQIAEMLRRIPKHKRWIVGAAIQCLLTIQTIMNFIQQKGK